MKTYICLVLASLLAFESQAETVYVDDSKKFVWSRTGPSRDFRAGERIVLTELTVLQRNEQTKYVQVRDTNNNEYWIHERFLTAEPSAAHKLIDAINEIESLKIAHAKELETIKNRLRYLEPMEAINENLQNQLAEAKTELERARQRSQMFEDGFESEATFTGAIIILSGMFLGWLLSKVGGRQKRSGW